MTTEILVVGGGLAGSEAAWQAAERGLSVRLFEMRPGVSTGAHRTADLAELICSNSLGSKLPDRASGILMAEMDLMGSMLLSVARSASLPAGGALAVDREAFARGVTERIASHPRIEVIREEVAEVPAAGIAVVATGPLTSPSFADSLRRLTGEGQLYFFDALSPIVEASSLNESIVFRSSRYGRGEMVEGDYINAAMSEEEYRAFVRELVAAKRIPLREFEEAIREGVRAGPDRFFEGCLPVEVIAERGEMALAYGPLRPVGIRDPRTGRRPFAVVQLRQDNLAGDLYNLVGFQTNLTYSEQQRVFRMIPGLESARFARFGQMHRNTFLNSPRLLRPTLQHKERDGLLFAGQITGVEGYLGNIATGLLAGVNAARVARGAAAIEMPPESMLGALLRYVTHAEPDHFQPMKANLGLLPPLEGGRTNRRERASRHAARAIDGAARAWAAAVEADMRIATT
jgi:methylenetetrahydrofolate--tRNA-(uracil-5-)-methyltransferase